MGELNLEKMRKVNVQDQGLRQAFARTEPLPIPIMIHNGNLVPGDGASQSPSQDFISKQIKSASLPSLNQGRITSTRSASDNTEDATHANPRVSGSDFSIHAFTIDIPEDCAQYGAETSPAVYHCVQFMGGASFHQGRPVTSVQPWKQQIKPECFLALRCQDSLEVHTSRSSPAVAPAVAFAGTAFPS